MRNSIPLKALTTFLPGSLFAAFALSSPAVAQLIPDNTLGPETSQVKTDNIRGIPSHLIQGGALRGSNLFHSFSQFNVDAGRGVYFSNPALIKNILTRVTGIDPSNIFGTLGVLGQANLYLINPNGIVFGPNARLDIRGAFTAATADSILFENDFAFSASNPQAPPMLAVNVPVGLGFREDAGNISSQADLMVPGDLTLKATNLNLSGSLQSGSNLTVEGKDTVTIRDSSEKAFIAAAKADLLIQGNETVDISVLENPDSGFFSGGDTVLRSRNPESMRMLIFGVEEIFISRSWMEA